MRARARLSGSWVATQRSLLTVVAATGTRPVGVGPGLRAELGDEVVGGLGGAGVVPQQRISHDLAVLVEQHHAVLLATDGDGGDAVEEAATARLLPGRPPVPRVDLGAVGVRRTTGADDRPGLGVADDDLAGLGRRVDPGDERAISHGGHSLSIRART